MKKQLAALLAMIMVGALTLSACSSPPPAASSAASSAPASVSSESGGASTAPAANQDPAPDYPGSRSIQLICGAAAGGGTDTTGRLLINYLVPELGNVVMVNVKGAGGSIATRQVLDSAPDGYTISWYNEGTVLNQISGIADFGMADFEASIIPAVVDTITLLVRTKDFTTIEDVVDYAKANPGKLKFGMEIGTYTTQLGAALFLGLDIDGKMIDVGPTNDAIAALVGGHVDMIPAPVGMVGDYLKSGEFSVIALVNEERNPEYPDVPTLLEKGVDIRIPKYYYLGFPKGTPAGVIEKFSKAVENVSKNPEFLEDMKKLNITPKYMNVQETQSYMDAAMAEWEKNEKVLKQYEEKYGALVK